MNKILIVAGKELKDGLRNRWLLATTCIFAIFALSISFLGSAASGVIGFTSLESTMVSLASLATVLIPLISLMVAYNTFVGEYEQGTMLLLVTYPISRIQLLLGKFLGHCAIIAIAIILGFGLAGLAIIGSSDLSATTVIAAFIGFSGSSIFLGAVFISIAILISVLANEKSKAAGLALIAWFFFVLIYDLSLLGLLVGTKGELNSGLIELLLLFNPTDVFRLINYQLSGGSGDFSLITSANNSAKSLTTLFSILLVWIFICLSASIHFFYKKEA